MSASSTSGERQLIVDAGAGDVDAATKALVAAFAADPLVAYFFRSHPQGVAAASRRFFALLLRLRIALHMPVLLLKEGDRVLGAAMGYDTERPDWPEPFAGDWARLEAETPGFAERLHAYEQLSRSHAPAAPHYYLGVLGVAPSAQGTGAGRALLEAFCQRSSGDPLSSGVYLETSNRRSREFYLRQRFVERGADDLAGTPLWCVFRADAERASGAGGASGLQAIVAFVLELDKLKGVTRKTRPLGLERYENSAEHSWQIALLAAALVQHAATALDLDRVIRLLLVHDIGEIDTGDTMVYTEGGWEERKAAEAAAARRIFGLLPGTQGAEFLALWQEFEAAASPEARFANAVDRAMPVLLNLANAGQSWRENGISHARVLSRVAAPIREGCPALWEYLEARLEEERRRGWFGAAHATQPR